MKHYSPTGRRNHGRPLKRLLDTWDRDGSTSGPTPWQIYDDDDDDDDDNDDNDEYLEAMKCVVRQKCKCHGRLVAWETEFCKVAPNVCNGITARPPLSPNIQIAD
jgi:hypothetical protein